MAWSGSGATMRSLFWLLISLPVALPAAAQSPPPARVEIHYELMRNGSAMAEVVERLQHANGSYELTETWKGHGIYRLLGRAAALATDYSSVWTDFLTLDRPIGFVLNDLADYEQGSRGLNVPNLLELLPGPQLLSPEDCGQFATDALTDPPHLKELRATSAELVGLASPGQSATDALFAELRSRGLYQP